MRSSLRGISELPRELKLFLTWNVGLGCFCILCELYCYYVLHGHSPVHYPDYAYTWPTLWFNHWRDFLCWAPRFNYLHHLEFFSADPRLFWNNPALDEVFMYPAPGAGLFALFYSYKAHPLFLFLGVTAGCMLAAVAIFYVKLRKAGLNTAPALKFVVLAMVFAYPFWFEYDLGNMEIVIWILMVAAMWAYFTDRMYLAAALMGIAGSVKFYPLVFLVLLWERKQYRAIGLALVVVAAMYLVCLWMIYPDLGIAWHGTQAGMQAFREKYMLPFRFETGFDHSIYGLLKRAVSGLGHQPVRMAEIHHMDKIYLLLVAAVGVMAYFVRIRHLPILNQVLALTVATILFPPLSNDYTLMHLYVPWALLVLFVLRKHGGPPTPGLLAAFMCMAFLMSPETEFIHKGITVAGQMKCVVLIALFVISLWYPFREGGTATENAVGASGVIPLVPGL
jgi:hypothetical protein